jgi:thioesterase domain-containing protein
MEMLKRAVAAEYMPRIRPYSGEMTLFVAGERLREDPLKSPSCGWRQYVPALAIHEVNADHFSLMSDHVHVGQVAEVLAKHLSEPERQRTSARADAAERPS